jgi:hypothetical protein
MITSAAPSVASNRTKHKVRELKTMAAKDVRFSSDARDRWLRGIDILNKR